MVMTIALGAGNLGLLQDGRVGVISLRDEQYVMTNPAWSTYPTPVLVTAEDVVAQAHVLDVLHFVVAFADWANSAGYVLMEITHVGGGRDWLGPLSVTRMFVATSGLIEVFRSLVTELEVDPGKREIFSYCLFGESV
jgi:hypothetical protein